MTEASDAAPIRVLLVDDHGVVRRGLRGYLELLDDIEIVGEAENGLRGVELSAELSPDVILMEIVMPQLDGIAAISRIKASQPDVQIVALTSFIEEDKVLAALESGASGFILKDAGVRGGKRGSTPRNDASWGVRPIGARG